MLIQRFTWAETLGVIFLTVAPVIYIFLTVAPVIYRLAGSAAARAPNGPGENWGLVAAGAYVITVYLAGVCAATGLSLFLVNPLVRFKWIARAAWLVPLAGLGGVARAEQFCPGYSDCPGYVLLVGAFLIPFGAILTIRAYQVLRAKRSKG
jgi:hypothetical protein